MTGVDLIAAERQRQIDFEGFDSEQDDRYECLELVYAAMCYLEPPGDRDVETLPWPWELGWWKPTPEDRIRELAKAGALIAAEIDRLQRSQSNP